ncbi:uncharacterized protein CPUR_05681 [Claviceps purpurea 20.1]|uniref:Uncharacterized protein n=1 Tax=Claviceps purpurea (strain 20.1) TaxID=1111077 RepID=M1W2F2_CLAP2|nr:uncharacterized protein CPUR_05681 [Claviceps purpurea 20.1]
MDSAVREAPFMARGRGTDESRCLMALLPLETKIQIMSYIGTQQSLSRLAQSCGSWYGPATQELYTRDAKKHGSFAIKWMAGHAVDEQTTDSALRTLEISRRWGGQINTVNQSLWRFRFAGQDMYERSTALHFAVFLGNLRLTKTLLDMEASLEIPCPNLLWQSLGSEEVLRRVSYFQSVLRNIHFGPAFPIFLAFLQRDADMCKLLVEHGAGRKAVIVSFRGEPKAWSILHFAVADSTTDYRHWRCLFGAFREYINEPCPRESQYTPLHVALINSCTQGMQIAVEYGADKEARDGASRTPLSIGVQEILPATRSTRTFEERTMCVRKFVELGASVNPEGDSVLLHAVQLYASRVYHRPDMRHLIYFLLEHHANIHGTIDCRNTNVANEIIKGILNSNCDSPVQELLKELLSDLVDRGLNLTIPTPGLPSPLYRVLCHRKAKPEWLFDWLCEKGATIHEREVNAAFVHWCEISRLWRTNKYDAWWQNQGQEGEIFQKWCEHPYNFWWWQHVKHISRFVAMQAYRTAFKSEYRQLYDILTHLPLPGLPAPSDDLFVKIASESCPTWSWR